MYEVIKISDIKFDKCEIDVIASQKSIIPLVESIKINGLMHPITVDKENNIMWGFRRLTACIILGRKKIIANRFRASDYQEIYTDLM